MSWVNWIPVVGTINNALSDPKGRKVSDYTCSMDLSACGQIGAQVAAIAECNRIIDTELRQYITDYQGGAIADQYIGSAASVVGSVVTGLILKNLIAKGASSAVIGATGVGTVLLAIDALANLAITLDNLSAMKAAAKQAKASCCSCQRVRCAASANNQPIATGEIISGSYYGSGRSFRLTKEEMEKKAKDDYQNTCVNGGCSNGNCEPVAYLIEYDQTTRIFWVHTEIIYDVYCECV